MNIINSVIHTKRSQELVGQIIPILVGWAKYGLTNKTYGDLIHALGYTRYSGIGDQLGNVETVMRELRKMTGEEVPTLMHWLRPLKRVFLLMALTLFILTTTA